MIACREIFSPNCDARNTAIDTLVLHYTGMENAQLALERLCNPQAQVSAHYIIMEDGEIIRLVPEEFRAWHAGFSYWRGVRNINHNSIGIELVNPGHEFGLRPYPDLQIHALIRLCHDILARHSIPSVNVIGHSDAAPARKQDPGEYFPWEKLAREGIGLWPQKQAVPKAQPDIYQYGYDPLCPLKLVITAFQRHFSPHNLSGEMDNSTKEILGRILEMTEITSS